MRFLVISACVLAITYGYPQKPNTPSEDQQTAAANQEDDSDMYMEALEQQSQPSNNQERLEGSQSFYPSFAPFHNPPLGHSRPFYQPEGAYSHRPNAYQQNVGFDSTARFSGYKSADFATASESEGILGSGNFGVLKGGTFYNDNEGESANYDQYSSFYQNGHGRPSFNYGGNPRPRQYQQFENFRDFADINVPSNPAYSQYVIVYANKNGSRHEPEQQRNRPKNIMEHLALLDLETTTVTPTKKLSKSKRKLALAPREKKLRTKKTTEAPPTRDLYEPLLALS